jgi:hypothetical protein
MWHMREGALAYFSHAVWCVLNNTCHDLWIGRGGLYTGQIWILWSLILAGLETIMYVAPVDNKEALYHGIVNACNMTWNYPGISPWREVSRCVLYLMEDIVSTYYKCTFAAVTYNLNVSSLILIWSFFLDSVHNFQLHPVYTWFLYAMPVPVPVLQVL